MIDEVVEGVRKALDVASHYPDVVALVFGTLIGYVFTVMVELYFLPIETDPGRLRRQKGLTFILCWIASGACSSVLWSFLDPADSRKERIMISYLVGVLSFAAYPFLAKVATNLWPKIGSAWSRRDE